MLTYGNSPMGGQTPPEWSDKSAMKHPVF
jgi:hypothetical protein